MPMKILMTGMSTRTVGSSRLKLNYLNFNPLLKKALEEMGHVVDQRRITKGEILDYDVAFIHVSPGDKIVCQNVLEVCWALGYLGHRAILFCEDWVSIEFKNAWTHILNVRWDAWKKWKGYTEWTSDEERLVRDTISLILTDCPWPVIANFYGWGDPTEFFKENFTTNRCMVVDPSSMAQVPRFSYGNTGANVKRRKWILATLQKHDTWTARQNFSWPVETYGNERQGHPAITEEEVTQKYADNWGVLAPRYPVKGWFRPRFLLAAATGSVLFCDRSEGLLLGPEYVQNRSQIEDMENRELETLAREQAATFRSKVWSRERLLDSLSGLLEAIMVGYRGPFSLVPSSRD